MKILMPLSPDSLLAPGRLRLRCRLFSSCLGGKRGLLLGLQVADLLRWDSRVVSRSAEAFTRLTGRPIPRAHMRLSAAPRTSLRWYFWMWVRTWVVVRVPNSLEMAWMSAPCLHAAPCVSARNFTRRKSAHAGGLSRRRFRRMSGKGVN